MTSPARTRTGTLNWRPLTTATPLYRPLTANPRYEPYRAVSRSLPGRSPHSVGLARAHVAGVCQAWQLGEDVTGVLAVITSELVTNAVIHARGPHVIVDVMLSRRHVWVSVIDQGCPRAPIAARVAGEGAEDGRGLLLVDALATRWHATTRASGSRVWACVRLAPRDGPPHGTPLR